MCPSKKLNIMCVYIERGENQEEMGRKRNNLLHRKRHKDGFIDALLQYTHKHTYINT
jgi:hypothetical protein